MRLLRRLLQARPRPREVARALLALPVALCVVAALAVALTPLPPSLREAKAGLSVCYLDREGALLREVRAEDATRARWIGLDDVGPRVADAILAAEDRRFYEHPGVDILAIARAAAASLWQRRVVSGASTLTMQLARLVHPSPRSAAGKLTQLRVALRIEASLSKGQILEEYLNRAPFGPAVRGIDAGEPPLLRQAMLGAVGRRGRGAGRHPARAGGLLDRGAPGVRAAAPRPRSWAGCSTPGRSTARPTTARAESRSARGCRGARRARRTSWPRSRRGSSKRAAARRGPMRGRGAWRGQGESASRA